MIQNMTFAQSLSLLWKRFSPLEEKLLAAVRDVLPPQALATFDAQVAGINLVQRHSAWAEVNFYRRRGGRVDWSDIPSFPRSVEFRLAEIRFGVGGKNYKATLTSISGHIFNFTITPGAKGVAFDAWDSKPRSRLLADPLAPDTRREPEEVPAIWREFASGCAKPSSTNWTFHDERTAFRTAFPDGEFLVLAEREGDGFVLHRVEPPASTLFYLASHDGSPEPITGSLAQLFESTNTRKQ